jgi:hypothetical protein
MAEAELIFNVDDGKVRQPAPRPKAEVAYA